METEALHIRAQQPVLEDVFETRDPRLGGKCWRGAYCYPDREMGGFIDTYTPTFRTADEVHQWFADNFDRLGADQ